jgi:HPt (histidine-containing phosphotransfer) domain-containing protein
MAPLDPTALASLRELDTGAAGGLLPRLVPAFERTLDRALPEFEAGLPGSPDLVRIGRAAHLLKSACAQLAALDAAQQCADLEALCRAGHPERVPAAIAALKPTLAGVRQALHALTEPTP